MLFFYSFISIFYPNQIKIWHEKSLKNDNNIFSKYALENSKKRKSNFSRRFSGFGLLIMSMIMIYLITKKLFF